MMHSRRTSGLLSLLPLMCALPEDGVMLMLFKLLERSPTASTGERSVPTVALTACPTESVGTAPEAAAAPERPARSTSVLLAVLQYCAVLHCAVMRDCWQ